MDAVKTIKKYICPGVWMSILGWILAAVTAVSLILGAAAMILGQEDVRSTAFYPGETSDGSMAYIDVVGVSDWLYRADDTTYYSVEDAAGYLYTVRLSASQFNEMADQYAYFNREDENAPMPEAVRLEGFVMNTPSGVREALAECWSITEEEYDMYFGPQLLDATTTTGEQRGLMFFMAALFSGVFALICLIFPLRAGGNAKKCLRRLEERGLLEKAAEQLEASEGSTVIGKKRGILTRDFLFGKGTGVVVAYDDILWTYQQDRRRNFMVVNCYLMIATRFMNAQGAIDLNQPDRQGTIGYAISLISQHNPKTLVGFTGENVQAYKAIVRGE